MQDWIIGLIAGLVTAALTTVITTIIGVIIKRKLEKSFKEKDEKAQQREQELKRLQELETKEQDEKLLEKIKGIVQAEINPLLDKVTKIESGTLDTLRDRILSVYYKCVEKGYRTQYDFENVHHMYKDYLKLNGNSYVEDVMRKFDQLPSEEEYRVSHKSHKATKKQKQ